MLIFEGIKNRGIAFSPLIRKLIEAKDSMELDAHIEQICEMMSNPLKYHQSVRFPIIYKYHKYALNVHLYFQAYSNLQVQKFYLS